MPNNTPDAFNLSREEIRSVSQTLTGMPARNDQLVPRLEYVAELLADAGKLPSEPVLVWREGNRKLKYAPVGVKLVVGRQAEGTDVALRDDKLLSAKHFAVKVSGEGCKLKDLNSRNGTAVNEPQNRIRSRLLRDGDLILAGKHIFVFLDQRRTS